MENWALGIDLGATKIETALISPNGEVYSWVRAATNAHEGYQAVLGRIVESVQQLLQQSSNNKPVAVGIGVPGQIEKNTGLVTSAPNLNWHKVNLQQNLADKIKLPVAICNDVRAATWGEWLYGAGKDCNNLICVFVGTGIGGGIVSGGQVLEGTNNTAGEIGHITIDINGPECHCGNKGCFEALAGGWAIDRDARAAVAGNKIAGKTLLELANGDVEKITGKHVTQAAERGDALAKQLMDNVAKCLIAGSVGLVNALGPQRLIFGGGVIDGTPWLVDKVRDGVMKLALAAATEQLQVLPAKLGQNSGVVGAAAFALRSLNSGNGINENKSAT